MSRWNIEHLYIDTLAPTPLVPIRRKKESPRVWCKLEFLNASGSTKDRIARAIIEKAWREDRIRMGSEVVEASSGSTSIALALVCAQMGLKFCAIMPENVSKERSLIIKAYGGKVILSPKIEGMKGAMALAKQKESEGAFYTRQFENIENLKAHQMGTGQEILAQIPGGEVDAVACGVGTGGTIMGLQKAFCEAGCHTKVYAARPVTPSVFGGMECSSFSSKVPGVLEGFSQLYIPEQNRDIDQIAIAEEEALQAAKELIRMGFPVGPSSGLNFVAAELVAKTLGPDAQVVTVFPDRMERYFSTDLFV